MIEKGDAVSIAEIANQEKMDRDYVASVMRLTSLAPDITTAILNGRQPQSLQLASPVCIRFSWEERERLDKDRGQFSVSAYIRQKLFGDEITVRPKQYTQKQRQPKIDHVEIARLLGMFGQSELARSMLALSIVAQSGELDVTPDVSDKLERACDDIHDIKIALILALGIKPQGIEK